MRSILSMFCRLLLPTATLVVFSTTASAQSDWVGQFLHRYRPPVIDPSATVTPEVSDAAWRQMVRDGILPVAVSDVIRLMLESNLDVTVNRFSPLSSSYFVDTLLRTF